jgi:hypothetical protein
VSAGNLWADNLWADNLWADGLWAGIDEQPPTGGWESFGGENAYNSRQRRKKDREERLKRIRQELRNMNRWR